MAHDLRDQCREVQCRPVAKAVLMTLALDTDAAGVVRRSPADLATETCCSLREVHKGLIELERAGHISRTRVVDIAIEIKVHPGSGGGEG